MKLKWMLAVAILALASGVLWLRQQAPDSRNSESLAIAPGPDSATSADPRPVVLQTPEPVEINPESVTPRGEAERVVAAAEKVDFEAKYSGWSLERLEGAKTLLNKSFQESVNQVLDERTKAGLVEELLLKEGEASPPMQGPNRTKTESAGPGLVRLTITRLPFEEYPQTQALQDEFLWVKARVTELSKPAKR